MAADLYILIRNDYNTACDICQVEDDYDVSLYFYANFCIAYTGLHHTALVSDYKGEFKLREIARKVANAFGQNEVWYTSDMVMDQYDTNISLDDFIVEKQKQGYYAEFNPEELLKLPRRERPLYSVYHDIFED